MNTYMFSAFFNMRWSSPLLKSTRGVLRGPSTTTNWPQPLLICADGLCCICTDTYKNGEEISSQAYNAVVGDALVKKSKEAGDTATRSSEKANKV
jgi:hypothetical protein